MQCHYKVSIRGGSFTLRLILYGLSHLIKVFKPSTVGTAEAVRAWVNARIWFNMVDAQFHESITHLGKDLF